MKKSDKIEEHGDLPRFDDAMSKLLRTPKAEIDRREAEAKKVKPEKKRKAG